MTKKPRRQIYTMETYLKKIVNENIRSDQDVQRLSGQWDHNMVNELMVTVLTEDYMPPIILGEENRNGGEQLWIIEGLQRSTSLSRFRYGNYKISSSVEDYMIPYQRQVLDEHNVIQRDLDGNIMWETLEFDIRNKTYHDLPPELKSRFNEYQLETVIHEDCTMETMSKLVRRYNNHKAMNASQKAFTYIDCFARDIREITNHHRFFKDCGKYTQKEKENGTFERIVTESVMTMFHINHWQKQSKKMDIYLNKNATKKEFDILKDNLDRLERIIGEEQAELFNSKNSFIWFTLFEKFKRLNLEDKRFADFLSEFKNTLHMTQIAGESFDELDKNRSTKDKKIVMKKLGLLEKLMLDYLCIEDQETVSRGQVSILQFVRENVNADVTEEDIDQYEEVLDDLTLNVDHASKLLEKQNRFSLVGIVAYSFSQDMDLDHWIVSFFQQNHTYIINQTENYRNMKAHLETYRKEHEA